MVVCIEGTGTLPKSHSQMSCSSGGGRSAEPGGKGAEAVQVSEHRLRGSQASFPGMAQHGTAHRSCARLTGGPVPGCCFGDMLAAGATVDGHCRVPLQRASEQGLLEWRSQSTLARRLAACVRPCGHARSLSEASLSRKAAACLGGTFPASIIFPLFYSNCTCANKMLTGAKPCSFRERRELP